MLLTHLYTSNIFHCPSSRYYTEIFDLSGTGALAQQYGDWFTWDGAPRAKIFARDHSKVTDIPSLIQLMQ